MQEKRKQFYHGKQLIYEWDQTLEDVILYLKPPKWTLKKYEAENKKQFGPNFQTQKLLVTIENKRVTIGVQNQKPFLSEELSSECKPKESYWQIEDDELVVQLGKIYKGDVWDSVFKGHKNLDVVGVQEEKKKLMLERFQEEHKGFDFSNAQFNGNVPDPKKFMGGLQY